MGKKIYTIFKDGKTYQVSGEELEKQRGWHGDPEGHARAAATRGASSGPEQKQPGTRKQPTKEPKGRITGGQVATALLAAAGIAAAIHPASRALLGRGIASIGHKIAMRPASKAFARNVSNIDKKGFFDGLGDLAGATEAAGQAYKNSIGARIVQLGTKVTPKGRKLGVGFDVAEDLIGRVRREII